MSRRTTALTLAGICLVALVCVVLLVPLPYVVMSPGVTENTLGSCEQSQNAPARPIVRIDGHRRYQDSGNLDLTTVSVTSYTYHPRLPDIMRAWWDDDELVLPRDLVYPPDRTGEQVKQENRSQMLDSQSAAIAVGMEQAGVDALHVVISDVSKGAPADGVLRKGDRIVAVDGQPIEDAADAADAIGGREVGSDVTLTIERDGSRLTKTLPTEASSESPDSPRIGVGLSETFDPPFTVDIKLCEEIGGPSAGLMFSLAIYDLLTPGSLTGGRYIAGTGTIDSAGQVGPIGGVQQKIAGAYQKGARAFLVPAGDCEEAAQSSLADKLDLIRVESIDQAVTALENPDDDSVESCGGNG